MPILLSRTVKMSTIDGSDLVRVGRFLHTRLNALLLAEEWAASIVRHSKIAGGVPGRNMDICFRSRSGRGGATGLHKPS